MPIKIIELSDEDGIIFIARTDMSELEIKNSVLDWENNEANDNLDYEEKCIKYAKENNKIFEKISIDERIKI